MRTRNVRLTFFVLILLFGVVLKRAFAEEVEDTFSCNEAVALTQAELSKTVRSIQQSYEQNVGFHAKFQQRSYLSSLDAVENSRGEVWFSKPGKMKWLYASPEEKLFLLVGKNYTLVEYVERQALRGKVEAIFLSELPVAFLLGLGELEKSFEIKQGCRRAQDASLVLTFTPRHDDTKGERSAEQVKAMRFFMHGQGTLPVGVEITDSVGNTNTFLFEEVENALRVPDSLFQVEIPNGFDVQEG